ncbi:ArsS family sensor histidine kinase [Sulfurospirillum sp. 1612]|uniref:ArsS family sensor histidine kinase n=1 Tax=Sulfurospirillum sp. 1612 TaxID=3094835 RepID=UPI002F95198A
MREQSLSSKITIIFVFSLILLGMFFVLLLKYQEEKNIEHMKQRQFQSINYLFTLYRNNYTPRNIEEYFHTFDLKKVENPSLKQAVLDQGTIIYRKSINLNRFTSIEYNDKYYLFIESIMTNVLLESNSTVKNSDKQLWIGFAIALIIFISMYISIIRSISPLKELSLKIREFASGNMNIDCKSDQDDEIAEVANEFDRAVKKISALMASRQLFLRTIMHELKTPIGKGRIVSEMLEDDKAKNRLITIFERLDILISEFAKIEQLVSQSYTPNFKNYNLIYVLDHATDLLMLENDTQAEHVKVDIVEELILRADFELLALAMKNLMDNAIKHSVDHVVHVRSDHGAIIFENSGEKLPLGIEEYLKPFISGNIKQGLGLGLYIVKNIVELHDFSLEYYYFEEKKIHQFKIIT